MPDEILLECHIDITNRATQTLKGVMVETGEAYLYPIPVKLEIKIAKVGQKIDFLL